MKKVTVEFQNIDGFPGPMDGTLIVDDEGEIVDMIVGGLTADDLPDMCEFEAVCLDTGTEYYR